MSGFKVVPYSSRAWLAVLLFAGVALAVISSQSVRIRNPAAGNLNYEIWSPQRALLPSVFAGPFTQRFAPEQVELLFAPRPSVKCAVPGSGISATLAAWLSPPSVLACPVTQCSGHWSALLIVDCSGCTIGNCDSGGTI
jgi:hypothetical protein